jgi:hypothetical protein
MNLEEFTVELEELAEESATILHVTSPGDEEREARLQIVRDSLARLVTESAAIS